MRVVFQLGDLRPEALSVLLGALTRINVAYLTRHPATPALYRAGVRYRAERWRQEDWQDIPTTLKRRQGDCEDLACWRAAELRVAGDPGAQAVFRVRATNAGPLFHILVRHGSGRIEDPSKLLGM